MIMVKRCSFGVCDSESRYPDRLKGDVKFVPFPKPKTNYEKCLRWIKLCGRPHDQLNPSRINSNRYLCTKHFANQQWPTKEYPDPLSADPYTPQPKPHRTSPAKRRSLIFQSPSVTVNVQTVEPQNSHEEDKENRESSFVEASSQTANHWVDPLEMMSLAVENDILKRDLTQVVTYMRAQE